MSNLDISEVAGVTLLTDTSSRPGSMDALSRPLVPVFARSLTSLSPQIPRLVNMESMFPRRQLRERGFDDRPALAFIVGRDHLSLDIGLVEYGNRF